MKKRTKEIIKTNDLKNIEGCRILIGETLNNFTVLSLYGFAYRNNGQRIIYWNVQCKCGDISIKDGFNLIRYNTSSRNTCKVCRKYEDITNKKFNNYLVESLSNQKPKDKNTLLWNVVCDCGERYLKTKRELTKVISNDIKKCRKCFSHSQRKLKPPEDIIGKKFNNFMVIKLLPKTKKNYYWEVECECGFISEKTITNLESHIKRKGYGCKSCSNYLDKNYDGRKKFVDFTGTLMGNYKVLEFLGLDDSKSRIWLVKCTCGSKPRVMTTANLTNISKLDEPTCSDCHRNNFIGKTFNNYKVLDVVKDTDSYKFEIICTKCENKFSRTLNSLRAHVEKFNTDFCIGCIDKLEIGSKVNNFTVIEQLEGKQWRDSTVNSINLSYRVKCDCGEEYIKTKHVLQTISQQSTKQCDKCYRENVKK